MASALTYYVAQSERVFGARAADAVVAEQLESAWHRNRPASPSTIVDGVSAWRDDAGALQLRVIRNAVAARLDDAELRAMLEARVR